MFLRYALGVKARQFGDFRIFVFSSGAPGTKIRHGTNQPPQKTDHALFFSLFNQVYSIGSFCLNISNFKYDQISAIK
jgi:hypothetical protein